MRSGSRTPVGGRFFATTKALRRDLGVEDTPGARRFPFNNTKDFAFSG